MSNEMLWAGCGECDVAFLCHNGKQHCIRLHAQNGMVLVPEKVLWDAITALERSEHHVTFKQKSDAAMALRLAARRSDG